jgi:hypothetical protein
MRLAVLSAFVLALAASSGVAGTRAAGTLSVEDARGTVTLRGTGTTVGRMERGELVIFDLSPLDQWSPRVNGVPRGRVVSMRGKDVNFYVPGGRYRVVLRGEGISLSARGRGLVGFRPKPDATGSAGSYAVGDDPSAAVSEADAKMISFGSREPDPDPE